MIEKHKLNCFTLLRYLVAASRVLATAAQNVLAALARDILATLARDILAAAQSVLATGRILATSRVLAATASLHLTHSIWGDIRGGVHFIFILSFFI